MSDDAGVGAPTDWTLYLTVANATGEIIATQIFDFCMRVGLPIDISPADGTAAH